MSTFLANPNQAASCIESYTPHGELAWFYRDSNTVEDNCRLVELPLGLLKFGMPSTAARLFFWGGFRRCGVLLLPLPLTVSESEGHHNFDTNTVLAVLKTRCKVLFVSRIRSHINTLE